MQWLLRSLYAMEMAIVDTMVDAVADAMVVATVDGCKG